MTRVILFTFCAALLLSPARAADAPVTVTITQRAPIETLSPTGDVTGVQESTVGTKMTLLSFAGTQLTLQDASGAHFLVDASATDYTPPPAPVAVAPAPKPATTTWSTNPAPAAPAAPAHPPVSPAIASTPVMVPASAMPASDSVVKVPMTEDRQTDNVMAVWPPGGVAGRPLLVVAHGHGGSGPDEIFNWLAVAKAHNFTVVCPTFQSAVNTSFLPSDEPYFRHCLSWITDNLQFDKDNVYMTGFSGGGYATWYLGTQHPDFFRGLFLQSGNFAGSVAGLELGRWFDRPLEVIWGSSDLPDIIVQGHAAMDALKEADCKNVVNVVVPNAGHQEHPDLVAAWMEQASSSPPPSN